MESLSLIGYKAISKKNIFNIAKFSEQGHFQKETIKDIDVLHPYLGYVYSPENNNSSLTIAHTKPISEYGFLDDKNPIFHKSSNEIVIGIYGGSVAYWFSAFGINSFIQEIKKIPSFSGKDITIVRLALGGYKQPQQVLTLTYLLGLGAQFDIVINLDGFNEISLPVVDNISKQIFPFYPHSWWQIANELPDSSTRILRGEIIYLQERKKIWDEWFFASKLRYSNCIKLVWSIYDTYLNRRIEQKELEMINFKSRYKRIYALNGPQFTYANEQELYEKLTAVWSACSFQMYNLCKANNILYYHFLQPNQYVFNTKHLNEEEQKIAYSKLSPYRIPVEKGYPYLIKAGRELKNQGEKFYDLTPIFNNYNETAYIDNCCHINEKANAYLGIIMGKIIVQDLTGDQK